MAKTRRSTDARKRSGGDAGVTSAIARGRTQALAVAQFRKSQRRRRARAVAAATAKPRRQRALGVSTVPADVRRALGPRESTGLLIAEGDSWFDYPLHDVLRLLEDDHGYDVESVAHKGLRNAYAFLISGLTELSKQILGRPILIVLHGYHYPIPDGRGFLGGFFALPGPWLEPGFHRKGYADVAANATVMRALIDSFNAMLKAVGAQTTIHARHVSRSARHVEDGQHVQEGLGERIAPDRQRVRDRGREVRGGHRHPVVGHVHFAAEDTMPLIVCRPKS